MGNPKKNKEPKKRKAPNKSVRNSSSNQKENVPKNVKTRTAIKHKPIEGIAMSKQLLLKKNIARTQRRSSSNPERVCPNGKPIPSLSELEKMFEDSDTDDQTPKTPTGKLTCTTSTPEKQTPINASKKLLFSPTTINKISEKVMCAIQTHNLPDPSEVLEATTLLREKTPPPAPIIPPKKRKKPEVPYIVGCKDRPKVIKKPNTNFCKGHDDYGVENGEDPEDDIPKKRAKKSRIPNYSKSIFNAQSDEIAERLINEDGGGLSDASSDSNKTIEYDPTPFQNLRPYSFSPLPSTSKDSETFRKNDELFNESLKEISLFKASTPINKLEEITPVTSPKETEDNAEITNNTTPDKKTDSQTLTKLPLENEDDIQIIDNSYDTIVIDDISYLPVNIKNTGNPVEDKNVIEIVEPEVSEVIIPKKEKVHEIPNDEDCMIVTSLNKTNNHKNLDEPIVIDDEYSSINMDLYSFNNDEIEIIDVDDVIAENKSILEKWKTSGAKELNKINAVVDVPTTYSSITSQQTVTPITTHAPQDIEILRSDPPDVIPITTVQTTPSETSHSIDQNSATNIENNQRQVSQSQSSLPVNQNSATNIDNIQRQTTPVRTDSNTVALNYILHEYFRETQGNRRPPIYEMGVTALFDSLMGRSPRNAGRRNRRPTSHVNSTSAVNSANSASANSTSFVNSVAPVPTINFQTNPEVINSSSNSGTQLTTTSTTNLPPSPVPSRNIGDCPICLDPLSSSNGIASTICGHVFCLKCIQASVRTSGKKCPTCRKALKGAGGGYHQLYL